MPQRSLQQPRHVRQELTPAPQTRSVRSSLIWALAALPLVFLFDAALFRTGWYSGLLEPNSSAGQFEAYLDWLRAAPPDGRPEIAVFGDSRIAHGFSARLAAEATQNRVRFWNFGIAGTLPRDWFYFLRDADPTHRRFADVLLALDQYSDEDYLDVYADRLIDLNFLIVRLHLADCLSFAASMKSFRNRERALWGCVLRGVALQSDFLDWLDHPIARARAAADWRDHGLDGVNAFSGIDRNLDGLSADWQRRQIHFPPGLDAAARATIQATVMPSWPPYSGDTTRYRERWLPQIFSLYRGSPTRVVVFELPRAPLSKPESATPSLFLDRALPRGGFVALDRSTFRDLERPAFFFDGLHLNRAGRLLLSDRLAGLSISWVAPSQPAVVMK